MIGSHQVYSTAGELARAAAEIIASLLLERLAERESASIVLAGGSTPRGVYSLLGAEPLRSTIPWARVHVFWGDERCVPPDHEESNFRMANETLLQNVAIPPPNTHRINGEHEPGLAAREYEEDIRRTFKVNGQSIPQFDVILLGLGDDGHTASLFPGTPVLYEQHRWVGEVHVPTLNSSRITLTLPIINNAHHILFLVAGDGKASIFKEVAMGTTPRYPAQFVRPVSGDLRWLVDREAASRLESVNKP